MKKRQALWAGIALAVYVGAIALANWMISHVGTMHVHGTYFLPVGFGKMAPSGTYAAGITFVARDIVQRFAGRRVAFGAILVGVVISYFLAGASLALASGAAFLFSETADFLVYTPLERRRFVTAVVASGVVGSVIDSVLFLWIAGIPFAAALLGLIIGKVWIQFGGGVAAFGLRRLPVMQTEKVAFA